MRKVSLLSFILSFICLSGLAQPQIRPDIAELKNQLPYLHDSLKVEALNRIATFYVHSLLVQSDSGIVYAKRALDEAERIGDKKRQCRAAGLYANVLLQLSRPNEGLYYYRLTAQLARETQNTWATATAIRGMGQALWYQGNFQKAIDTILLSVRYFRQLNANHLIADATIIMSSIHEEEGNYEKAFEVAQQALTLSKRLNDTTSIILSLAQLGKQYRNIGDYATALEYYKKCYSYRPAYGEWSYRHLGHCMGDLYKDKQQYDSAFYYYNESFAGSPNSKYSKLKMAELFYTVGKYDTALALFRYLYNYVREGGEGHIFIYATMGIGKVYHARKDYANAFHYGEEAFAVAQRKSARINLREAALFLSKLHEELRQPGHAFHYYKLYVQMKDAVISDQFKAKLYEFRRIAEDDKKLAQIELLKKEKLLTSQNLRQTQILRNILIGGILILALLAIIVFWSISLKRKNENLQNERIQNDLQRRATDLEMQALRAQMNPHFIFNCLSSINRFILKNEPDKASDYLTRFSRLIRLVLINSQKSLIVLEDEIEMLRLYIEMEQLRFKNSFDYSITYTNDIEPANIMIPPLLLQPFCENAIWHGLMHKQGHGELAITFHMQNHVLNCIITDNGIGRAKAGEIKNQSTEKLKSLGLKLTAERLALFNEDRNVQTFYEIQDVIDESGTVAGTKVILEIRYREFFEDPALK